MNAETFKIIYDGTVQQYRPQPTRRTSWKPVLPTQVGNTGFQLVCNFFGLPTSWHDMQVGNLLYKWNVEKNQACNKLPTSWKLVRLVGCGLMEATNLDQQQSSSS